jgi:transcriptional regulator with XRE-family HTH domain
MDGDDVNRDQNDAIAATLREIRLDAGLTQPALAQKSGVGIKSISSYETGARTASLPIRALVAIVPACGITLAAFFQRVDMARRLAREARVYHETGYGRLA